MPKSRPCGSAASGLRGTQVTGTSAPTTSKRGAARSTAPAPASITPKCTEAASSPTSSTLAASVQPVVPRSGRSYMLSSALVPFAASTRSQAPAQSSTSWPRSTALNRTRRPRGRAVGPESQLDDALAVVGAAVRQPPGVVIRRAGPGHVPPVGQRVQPGLAEQRGQRLGVVLAGLRHAGAD